MRRPFFLSLASFVGLLAVTGAIGATVEDELVGTCSHWVGPKSTAPLDSVCVSLLVLAASVLIGVCFSAAEQLYLGRALRPSSRWSNAPIKPARNAGEPTAPNRLVELEGETHRVNDMPAGASCFLFVSVLLAALSLILLQDRLGLSWLLHQVFMPLGIWSGMFVATAVPAFLWPRKQVVVEGGRLWIRGPSGTHEICPSIAQMRSERMIVGFVWVGIYSGRRSLIGTFYCKPKTARDMKAWWLHESAKH
jgi:hypothetical protein